MRAASCFETHRSVLYLRKRLDRDAVETRVMTSDEFTAFVASEIDKWTPVARRVMPGN